MRAWLRRRRLRRKTRHVAVLTVEAGSVLVVQLADYHADVADDVKVMFETALPLLVRVVVVPDTVAVHGVVSPANTVALADDLVAAKARTGR